MRIRLVLILLLTSQILVRFRVIAGAEELTVRVEYLGIGRASPFRPQLLLHVTNEGYTPAPLIDKLKSSQLLIDGRSFSLGENPLRAPEGLSVKGSWEGCVPLDHYAPSGLEPGSHQLQLRIGDTLSPKIRFRLEKSAPAAGSPADRLRQADLLKDAISQGMLRSCVENWLEEADGGVQTRHTVRYYLEPDVKIVVPYEPSTPEPRVKGRLRTYTESRMLD